MADGFKVAEELKKENPEAFQLLTTTMFENFDLGNKTDSHGKYNVKARHPTIRLALLVIFFICSK